VEETLLDRKNETVFSHLGIRPVINCCGVYTDFGGSRLSPTVWAAMQELNQDYAKLPEMFDATGDRIASLLGAEAALVTPGAAAAIMLGTAACMAGMDGKISASLPDVTGAKSDVLVQAGHRYKYDRQVKLPGAALVEVGSENGTRIDQIESALSSNTAMFLYPAHLEGKPGTLSIDEVSAACKARGVPLFVDAAFMCYPTNLFADYIQRGADLVAVSSKYFSGPNAGGFIMGKKSLIDAVTNVYFTRYESGDVLKYGRPLKMDRQIVAAVVLALEEWLATDHDERLLAHARHAQNLKKSLDSIPGLSLEPMYFTLDERLISEPVNCLVVRFEDGCKLTAGSLEEKLAEGDRPVAAIREGDALIFALDVVTAEEVAYVGRRINEIAAG
jgi:D-glucosaminate-6-phosphate ammonia-lyase